MQTNGRKVERKGRKEGEREERRKEDHLNMHSKCPEEFSGVLLTFHLLSCTIYCEPICIPSEPCAQANILQDTRPFHELLHMLFLLPEMFPLSSFTSQIPFFLVRIPAQCYLLKILSSEFLLCFHYLLALSIPVLALSFSFCF